MNISADAPAAEAAAEQRPNQTRMARTFCQPRRRCDSKHEKTVENSSIFLADSPSPVSLPASDTLASMAVESWDSESGPRPARESGRAAGPAAGPDPLSRLVDSVYHSDFVFFKFLTRTHWLRPARRRTFTVISMPCYGKQVPASS